MIDSPGREGTPEVKRSGGRSRVKVSADGRGVVSHAGTALLREPAEETGLFSAATAALLDTYRGVPVHAPGQVFADLAVAIADRGGRGDRDRGAARPRETVRAGRLDADGVAAAGPDRRGASAAGAGGAGAGLGRGRCAGCGAGAADRFRRHDHH